MEMYNFQCQCKEGYRQVREECVACSIHKCTSCMTGEADNEVCLECNREYFLHEEICE